MPPAVTQWQRERELDMVSEASNLLVENLVEVEERYLNRLLFTFSTVRYQSDPRML